MYQNARECFALTNALECNTWRIRTNATCLLNASHRLHSSTSKCVCILTAIVCNTSWMQHVVNATRVECNILWMHHGCMPKYVCIWNTLWMYTYALRLQWMHFVKNSHAFREEITLIPGPRVGHDGSGKVAIYRAVYRFTMSINGMDLRCVDPWLNIYRGVLILAR